MQITISNGTLTQISETLSPSQGYALPSSVTVTGATSSYSDSTGVLTLTSPTSSMSVTAVAVQGDKISLGTSSISKIFVGNSEVAKIYWGSTLLYERTVGPSVDPVLANNSWETIKAVCQAGNAGNYWSLGDTKTVTGSDGYTRTVRIDDMSGLYGKHVVFSFLNRTETDEQWASYNVNSYANSAVKTAIDTGGSIFSVLVDSDLAAQLTDTTVQVAAGGNDGTLVSVTGKMFLPAEREIFASRTYSRTEEWNALTQYQYYSTHNTADARKRYKASTPTTAGSWWLRSPRSDYTDFVCYIYDYGNASYDFANNSLGVAPCFSF